jgi:ABC-type nitrate/sulfonate/bicarbonate transport system ATPase subunit
MNAALEVKRELAALSLSGVGKHFDALEVLRDISFDVANGEIVALLGTSGCGKSTLLNIVSGLLKPDRGSFAIEGAPAAQFQDWQRVAYLFQEDRLLPWRSVKANVAFGLEATSLGKHERAERVAQMLRLVGLEAFANAWPHQLSGGMRSRVALARSLVVQPQILLMDEPFSKLDPHTRSQMHDELLRLQALTAMTVLAVVLADRVIVLEPRPGRIRAIKSMSLARPRIPTDPAVTEQVRQLRLEL